MTRRAAADDVLDFVADEQDLLSMCLMDGFVIDARALDGRQVTFPSGGRGGSRPCISALRPTRIRDARDHAAAHVGTDRQGGLHR
jgi:hypothetical protein